MTSPDLPVGGSTGLCHGSSAAVDLAAEWLRSTPWAARPRPLVPALRERFGLTAREACTAIGEAGRRAA